MCLGKDISYVCTTHKQLNNNVVEEKMLELLIWAFWFLFGAYSFWFFTQAKTFQPLTLDDLALTWKMHKQQTGCTASHIHSLITKNNEVVGLKCDCGYTFLQKRLISQKIHIYPQTSIAPLTSSKGVNPLLKTRGSLRRLGLSYSHIEEI